MANSLWAITSEHIANNLRARYFWALMRQEIGFFDKHPTGKEKEKNLVFKKKKARRKVRKCRKFCRNIIITRIFEKFPSSLFLSFLGELLSRLSGDIVIIQNGVGEKFSQMFYQVRFLNLKKESWKRSKKSRRRRRDNGRKAEWRTTEFRESSELFFMKL